MNYELFLKYKFLVNFFGLVSFVKSFQLQKCNLFDLIYSEIKIIGKSVTTFFKLEILNF